MIEPQKNKDQPIEISSISFPQNKRLILKKISIPLILFILVLFVLGWNPSVSKWIFVLLLGAICIIGVLNFYYLKVFYFTLGEDYILIKRHGLNPEEIIIEYNRIKDIVIHRDTLDRLFGLYELRFESNLISPVASRHARIEGLDQIEANELKVAIEHLIEKTVR